jgi:hypothetical protein
MKRGRKQSAVAVAAADEAGMAADAAVTAAVAVVAAAMVVVAGAGAIEEIAATAGIAGR